MEPVDRASGWLFAPLPDAVFVANLLWPVIALTLVFSGWKSWTQHFVEVLWAYFLVTPHRWVTLPLVFLDPDRFEKRPRTFVGLGIAAFALCAGVAAWDRATGAELFVLLLAADYLWNAWHFASQTAGVFRIYGRAARPEHGGGELEKLAIRVFVLFVLFRLSANVLPTERYADLLGFVGRLALRAAPLDFVVLAIPVALLARELLTWRTSAAGRVVYLVSFGSLYGLLLALTRAHQSGVQGLTTAILSLALSAAIFHSLEYLAIVSWAVSKTRQPRGSFVWVKPRWLVVMVAFLTAVGWASVVLSAQIAALWMTVNLAVSYLHYAYDGIIWKAPRRPA
ncbi:MAG: hypothetical protein ABMA64_35575 [Myxococcota bacterium]